MKKKTLFVLLPNLNLGGAEHIVITLLKNFDRSLFEITLVVLDAGSGCLKNQVPSDVQLVMLNRKRIRTALVKLVCLLRAEQPDILFSNLSHLNLGLAILRFTLPKKTSLIVRESNIVSKNVKLFPFSAMFRALYKLFYRHIDMIICQSSEMAEDLLKNYSVKSQNIKIINNPVDTHAILEKGEAFTPKRLASHVFVACGRMHVQKGFHLLINALSELNRKDWVLWLIGDGDLKDELGALSVNLGIDDNIRFLGFQENPYPYFKVADAFILSSRFEGMPNVVLEALAMNTQVIATPAPGGVTALLIKSSSCIIADDISVDGINSALLSYFRDPRKKKIEAELIAPFKVEAVTKQFEQTFIDIIS